MTVPDVELPRDPPANASPFGLALHYGNALMFEMVRRQAAPDQVRMAVLWYAAVFTSGPVELPIDQIVDEFRATLERLRTGARNC